MRNEERTFIGDEAVLIAVHVSNELVDLLLRQLTVDWLDDVLNWPHFPSGDEDTRGQLTVDVRQHELQFVSWDVAGVWPCCDPSVTLLWPRNDPSVTLGRVLRWGRRLTSLWPQCDLTLTSTWPKCDLRSCPEMWPVFSRSNTLNASRISSSESVLWIFFAIMLRNSGKSTVPLPTHASTISNPVVTSLHHLRPVQGLQVYLSNNILVSINVVTLR